jgi:hypothetical protein
MADSLRYLVALLVAGVVTAGTTLVSHSILLLLGIFVVYALTTAILWRFPKLLWNRDTSPSYASGVLAGGMTFGVLLLAQGLGEPLHVAVAVFGFGLTGFGTACGYWYAVETGAVERKEESA